MRVLFTHPHAWPHVRRGAERELHELAARLTRDGHHVRLVTSQPSGVTSRHRVEGVPTRYVHVPAPAALERRGWHHEARFGVVAGAAVALSRADVVQCFLYADAAVAGRFAAVRRRRPVVLKLTGTVRPERIARAPVDERLFRGALDRADEVWCNSRFAVAEMAAFGVEMHVVPAGVDTEAFAPGGERAPTPLVLCTSAPDEPRKRVEDLVVAWPAIRAAVPDAQLVLAGQAGDATRRRLRGLLPDDVGTSVTFAGLLDHPDLVELYQRAWVVVQPSVHEALGLSVLEAQACGTPVVGADSGATPELVAAAGAGGLFAPCDPAAAAEAVVDALRRPPDELVAVACRSAATAYDWDVVTRQVEDRHAALLEGHS